MGHDGDGERVPRRSRRDDEEVAHGPEAGTLQVGAVDDPAEAHADAMADAAMRRLRQGGHSSPFARAGGESAAGRTRIRRAGSSEVIGAEGGPTDRDTDREIESRRGRGRPLDPDVQREMEAGFDADFSGVRVHTDDRADRLNTRLSARAFTTGSDIFFRSGDYQPSSPGGRRLLAHELAHTAQQTSGLHRSAVRGPIRRAFTVKNTTWKEAHTISASGGNSVNGVFFVKNKSGKTLVVKAAVGAARNELAAEIMDMSGAHGTSQRTILLQSPEGKVLIKTLRDLASKYRKAHKTAKGQNPIKNKIQSQLESGNKYDSVTIMEGYENLAEVQELNDRADFAQILTLMIDNGFFNGLGRIHAADMLMGNEDRLQRLNLKNFFVNDYTGQAVGLDLDLNAASFQRTTGDLTGGSQKSRELGSKAPSLAGRQYKDFVEYSLKGVDAKRGVMVKGKEVQKSFKDRGNKSGMAVGNMADFGDPKKAGQAFDGFITAWKNDANLAGPKGQAARTALNQQDWKVPRERFLEGLDQGMKALNSKMEAIEARSAELQQNLGADEFLDPRVFRIRGMYYELRSWGASERTAFEALEMYAEHLVNGGTDHDFRRWAHEAFRAQIKRVGPPPPPPNTVKVKKVKKVVGF